MSQEGGCGWHLASCTGEDVTLRSLDVSSGSREPVETAHDAVSLAGDPRGAVTAQLTVAAECRRGAIAEGDSGETTRL